MQQGLAEKNGFEIKVIDAPAKSDGYWKMLSKTPRGLSLRLQ